MPDSTPARDDWRFVPNSALQAAQQQDQAQQWGDNARLELAQQWGDAQRASLPTPTLAAPSASPDQAAGDGGVPSLPPPPPAAPVSSPAPGASPVASPDSTLRPDSPVTAPLQSPGTDDAAGGDPYWLTLAKSQMGKPYIWGSAGGRSDFSANTAGFDCSGFVSYVMQDGLGIKLPAQTASAYAATQPIDASQAKPGDVVLYNMGDNDPHIQHIALYLGNGQVIQAGGGGGRNNVNIAPIANAGTYEFRRPVGSPNAGQTQTQVANVAKSVTPDSAKSDDLVHTAADAVTNWVGGAVNTVQNLGKTDQSQPTGGDYTSLLPGGTQNPVAAAADAAGQIDQAARQSPLLPSNMLSGLGTAISDTELGQLVKNYYSNQQADDERARQIEQKMTDPTGGGLNADEQHWLNHYFLTQTMAVAGAGDMATGGKILEDALVGLDGYSPDIIKPITDWAQQALKSGGKASEIGATIKRWIQENPLQQAQPDLAAPEMTRLEPEIQGAIGETTPVEQPASDTVTGLQNMVNQRNGTPVVADAADRAVAGQPPVEPPASPTDTGAAAQPEDQPPPFVYDPATDQWVDRTTGHPGAQNSPSTSLPPDQLPAGVTQDMVDTAHQRIDQSGPPLGSQANLDAHDQLDQLLANNADPGQIARFFAGLTGDRVTPTSLLRSLRTGSMAGGLSSAAKVAASPIIQVAMRAPVAAVQRIVEGRPEAIPAALQGGLAGLAEGAQDALQTLRYGINYRSALTGGAQGGYGFAPGLDVLGSNPLTRTVGTALTGLVRTHGAVADISAGIGRGANAALGASPAQAAEAGQQWALRSGEYGVVGKAVSNALEGLRQTNPAMDVVGQILVPFYRVGYNAFTQGVERSPLGLGGRLTDALQGKPLDTGKLANNLFGVGLAGLGFAQAAQGNITGQNPQNGAPQWSVRVPEQAQLGPLEALAKRDSQGNLWVPLRDFGPAGEALAQSASLYEAARDGNSNIAQIAEGTASNYVSHVYDDTWLRSIGDAFGMLKDVTNLNSQNAQVRTSATRDLQYQGGGLLHSLIPQYSLGSQVNKMATGGGAATATRPVRPTTTSSRPVRPRR